MADDIIIQGFVQGSAQGIAARLRAKDNGNGTWTLVARGLMEASVSVDLAINFTSGSAGDLLTPVAFDAATIGEGGPWALAYGTQPLTHTRLSTFSDTLPFAISVDGSTITEGALGYKFNMQQVVDTALNIDSITIGVPTTITTDAPHGWTTGKRVTIRGVIGSTNLNNTWVIIVTGPSEFTIVEESLIASSGGIVMDAFEGVAFTFPSGVEQFSVAGLVQFNAIGSTETNIGIDHIVVYAGGFHVMQQAITSGQVTSNPNAAGWLLAHGQDAGGSTTGPAADIVPANVYRFTLRGSFSEQEAQLILIDNNTGDLINVSYTASIVEDAGTIILQDYLAFYGGFTLVKSLCVAYNERATFPIGPFTCPAVTSLSATQSDTDEVTLAFSSRARNFLIERSANAGTDWDVIEANLYIGFTDNTVPLEYVDGTVSNTETYIYRVRAIIKAHTSEATVSNSVTIENGGGPVEPTDIAGLIAWFDAGIGSEVSTGVPAANNDSVEFWLDQSGNNYDANQTPTPASRPIFKTGIINARPVLRCVSNVLAATATPGNVGTIFVVVGNVNFTSFAHVVAGAVAGGVSKRFTAFYPDATTIFEGDSLDVLNPTATWVNGVATRVFPGSGSFGVVTQQSNSPKSYDGLLLLGKADINDPFVGDIAEIIIYDTVLITGDRTSIEAYLMDKYEL